MLNHIIKRATRQTNQVSDLIVATIARPFFLSGHRRKSSVREDYDEIFDDPFPPKVCDGPSSPITTTLEIVDTSLKVKKWPAFSILDEEGRLRDFKYEKMFEKKLSRQLYRTMARTQALDSVFNDAQRQGRISFYLQSLGEEAAIIGSAAALDSKDVIFAQYREVGALLWRGFTLQQVADQCFGNKDDLSQGRQMPVHYGSKAHNFHTISSPLATQLPQSVGAAYAMKLSKEANVTMCYFGEGAASEGDFHAALNFASTLRVPVIFFCRNNGYAISTPASEQYQGDGIISRAAAYGMHGIRVDGNDVFGVYLATKAARELSLSKSCPVLVEAMTYRRGHHSTSDDSTRYRNAAEIKRWQEHFDPLTRLRIYMEGRGWWGPGDELEMRHGERESVIKAMEAAEAKEKPPLSKLFEDVYAVKPPHLQKQEEEILEHVAKYPDHYRNQNVH